MGARSGVRLWAGMALALLLLASLPGPSVVGSQAMTDPPIEARAGMGFGMRVACIGCAAAWVYIGLSNPALMIYHAVRTPALLDACTLLCIQAVT